MAPPAPVIQASSSSVVVGENLRVSCSVVGEQDVGIEFTWDYPGQQVRHSQTLSIGLTQPPMTLIMSINMLYRSVISGWL